MTGAMWRSSFAVLVLGAAAVSAAVHSRPWYKKDCTVYTHHLDRPLKAVSSATFYVRHQGSLRRIALRLYGFSDSWDVSVWPPKGSKDPHAWHNVTVTKFGYNLMVFLDGNLTRKEYVSSSSKMTHLTVTLKGEGEVTLCDFRGEPPGASPWAVGAGVGAAVAVALAAAVAVAVWRTRCRSRVETASN
ncbi:uncharacterized protein LOC122242479 isoform X2 [Penaeus japonicus]|uniref:uncharacterized protein LOC122242479 isoform X2 n=1 Tax=Penaeus japonicus TaxID=27405 RepID=UPI001C70D8AE|nr:uncharacterized protein LOC122242479 isoform X2 [Penaeus japonicus]